MSAVDVGSEVAALHFYLATAQRLDHNTETMLQGIRPGRDAFLGSAQDDAWLWALNTQRNEAIAALGAEMAEPCPYCCAGAGEACREDCATRWDDGEA